MSADIPLVIVDSQHRIRRFTPQAAKVFSIIESDIGRPLRDFRNTFDLDMDELVSKVVESLETLDKEIQDKKGRWMRLQIRPFRTIDNRIDGAVIALIDIDALKTSLDTLQEREARLSHVLEATEMGSWIFDPKTQKNWRSLRHDQIFGYPTLLPEFTYAMFLEHVPENDRKEVDDAFSRALASITNWKLQCRIRRQDGVIRWIEVEGKPKVEQGQLVQATGLVRDISEQKEFVQRLEDEKAKLEAIFENSPASMALLRGPTFIYEKANSSCRELVGGRDIVGKAAIDATPEIDMQFFVDQLKKVLETGIPYSAKEVGTSIIRTPGGKPQDTYLDYTYSRVNDGQGKPYGIYSHAVEEKTFF